MKKYKQTCEIKTGSGEAFDVTKLKVGDKFMYCGDVCVRLSDVNLGQYVFLGASIKSGMMLTHASSHECYPFVGTITITQEEA